MSLNSNTVKHGNDIPTTIVKTNADLFVVYSFKVSNELSFLGIFPRFEISCYHSNQ